MSTSTSISIISTNADGKKVTDNINHVNPNLSDNNALLLAQMINALTDNDYVDTQRTDKRTLSQSQERTFTSIKYGFSGNPNKAIPADGIINCLTTDFPPVDGYYRLSLVFDGAIDPSIPIIEFSTTGTETIWYRYQMSCSYPDARWSPNRLSFTIITNNMDAMEAQVLTLKVTFHATATFDEWNQTFTFNITEPEEG